jgi:hypothetical protein
MMTELDPVPKPIDTLPRRGAAGAVRWRIGRER